MLNLPRAKLTTAGVKYITHLVSPLMSYGIKNPKTTEWIMISNLGMILNTMSKWKITLQ